jgi:uncharacterized protein
MAKTVQNRAWQRMLSGRRLDLLNPSPLDIEIEDIAHGLARVARWNGQTKGDHAFSVAQHCVIVTEIYARLSPGAERENRLICLLHDAAEYVVGDIISPFKRALGVDYKSFENQLLAAVHLRFGLKPNTSAALTKIIKQADRAAAYFEATELAGFSPDEARVFFGEPAGMVATDFHLAPMPAAVAAKAYLALFESLHS